MCLTIEDSGIALVHERSDHILKQTDGIGNVFLYLIHPDLIIHILPGKIISGGLIKESTCLSVVLSHRNNSYGLSDCWVFVFKKELTPLSWTLVGILKSTCHPRYHVDGSWEDYQT